MSVRRLAVVVAVLICALVPAATASAAPVFPQSKVLDSYEPNNDDYAGPVRSAVLTAGAPYVAEVQGTFSYYQKQDLRKRTLGAPWTVLCGTPMPSVMFRSSHVKRKFQGRANLDAENIFALPRVSPADCRASYPVHWTNFEVTSTATSGDYGHVEPIASDVANHTYSYPLLGAGQPAGFRLQDLPRTDDNYGELHIVIRPATVEECAGAFARFGLPDAAACTAPAAT